MDRVSPLCSWSSRGQPQVSLASVTLAAAGMDLLHSRLGRAGLSISGVKYDELYCEQRGRTPGGLLASAARTLGPSPWFGFPLCGEVGRKGDPPAPPWSLPFEGGESTVNPELGLMASGCFVGARQGSSASFAPSDIGP